MGEVDIRDTLHTWVRMGDVLGCLALPCFTTNSKEKRCAREDQIDLDIGSAGITKQISTEWTIMRGVFQSNLSSVPLQ